MVAAIDAEVSAEAPEFRVRLLATANPFSGAFEVCAAAVVLASDKNAEAAPSAAESKVGDGSAAAGLPSLKLPGVGLPDLGVAGCLAFAGSVPGAELLLLTGDCSVGIGIGAGVEAEGVSDEMLKARLVAGTAGLGL